MKSVFLSICLLMTGLLIRPALAATHSLARPELVQEVMDGKRKEARVSWWGFDANDSTEFLQAAINSKVRRLIIDQQASDWVTRPLSGVSNQEIVFENGTRLAALKGAFQTAGDCLLTFSRCNNIIIRGEKKDGGKSAGIRMNKADYQSDAYKKSEWRHGLSLLGCRNVLIQDLAVEKTGGDGIYLGVGSGGAANQNVVIRRVDCNDNHRQGISVISAENLLIEDCLLRNTHGTEPQAGIDFEPNSIGDSLIKCVMRNCISENNGGTGYQVCPQSMDGSSKRISIYLDHCISRGNAQHGIHLCSNPKNAPAGLLRVTHFLSENDSMAGLAVQFNPHDAVRIEMESSIIRNSARNDTFFPPLYLQGPGSDNRPAGGMHFKRVTIADDIARPFLRIRSKEAKDITGDITLQRNGQTETIKVDDALLRECLRKQ